MPFTEDGRFYCPHEPQIERAYGQIAARCKWCGINGPVAESEAAAVARFRERFPFDAEAQ